VQRNSELMENRCFVAVSRPRPALYLDYIKGTGTWHVQVESITYQRPSEDNDDDDDNVDIANKQLRNLRCTKSQNRGPDTLAKKHHVPKQSS